MSYGEVVPAARASGAGTSSALSAAPAQAAVTQHTRDGVRVVAAHGSCDAQSIARLEEALTMAVWTHPKVVLDASGITFADSSLLNLLILTHRTGTLRVAGPRPPLQRLLRLTGLDAVLHVRATVEEATAC
ncbi:STAS domain-containing protein [Streptomyces sp. NPDC057249]|uniref:STAS domain-containing protein n=1 Tax=Streptomyces sp. NPDC057249 TaxID=3346067 RepID=UPI00362DDA98